MSESSYGKLLNFKQTSSELTNDLRTLELYSRELSLAENADELHTLLERVNSDRFNVAILGEFKRGKSTLINALLNTPVLPADVLPTTATLNRVTYSPAKTARIEYKDGSSEDVALDELVSYVTKLTSESENRASSIKEAVVYFPTDFCRNNVDIVDTPGLNDDAEMDRVTYSVVPSVDAALFVMTAAQPFSASEHEFLTKKLLSSDVGRVIFVVTHIDHFNASERERILEHIRTTVRDKILTKAEQVYADEPEVLAQFKEKLGAMQVYGVSSTMAMQAREKGDDQLLAESGFPALENALSELLTQERGIVTLQQQSGRILSSVADIYNTIQIRLNAMTLTEEDFRKRSEQAKTEIDGIRRQKDAEMRRLDDAERNAQSSVLALAEQYITECGKTAETAIRQAEITVDDLKKERCEATQARLSGLVQSALETPTQVFAERVNHRLCDAVGKEMPNITAFQERIGDSFGRLQDIFEAKHDSITGGDTAIAAALNWFTLGGGSLYMGYKQYGWKGAAVGGLTGVAATFGGSVALGFVMGLVGITAAPAMIVAGIIAAVGGAFAGKNMVNAVFGGKKIDEFKTSYCKQVKAALEENGKQVREDVKKQTTDTFAAVKKQVGDGIEASLKDIEKSLAESQSSYSVDKAQREQQAARYVAIGESLKEISDRASTVAKQVSALAQ